ncbi:MAG: sugar phosphate isomerase/epimerase [Desulfobacterales bacterium]|nr:MAG: sugar phosphate isomerase/epimerase [Desulfobacterales bacterium]
MLALSTSWKSTETTDAEALLEFFHRLDISALELEYRISESTYQQMRKPLKKSRLKVVSAHNFFPKPSIKPESRASGDFFMLTSLDEEERHHAVQWTVKTISHAAELGAKAVVLHCGRVVMDRELDILYQFFKSNQIQSKASQDFIGKKLSERDELKPRYLENLLYSLDQLSRVADKFGILLGLENRFHYDELPTLEDFETLFRRFKGAPLGYWHDTGHAFVNESLTTIPAGALLNAYGDKLIGVHLHDAIGIKDHLAPGTGKIDFESLKSYLKPDTIKVLELKPQVADFEVARGIRFIRETMLN